MPFDDSETIRFYFFMSTGELFFLPCKFERQLRYTHNNKEWYIFLCQWIWLFLISYELNVIFFNFVSCNVLQNLVMQHTFIFSNFARGQLSPTELVDEKYF